MGERGWEAMCDGRAQGGLGREGEGGVLVGEGPGGAAGSICWLLKIALSAFVLQGLMRDESCCGYGASLVINASQNSH